MNPPRLTALCAALGVLLLVAAPGTAAPSPTALVAEAAIPPASAKPKELEVSVKRGLLSVRASETAFGEVLSTIANAAGFTTEISQDIYDKTVTTRFTDMALQRGILRLLTLINHRSYFMYYDSEGEISRIEIHGSTPSVRRFAPARGRGPSPATRPTTSGPPMPTMAPMGPSWVAPAPTVVSPVDEERQPMENGPLTRQERIDIMDEPEPDDAGDKFKPSELYFKLTPGRHEIVAPLPAQLERDADIDETALLPEEPEELDDQEIIDEEDIVEEEINPEGEAPPEEDLLGAPYIPPAIP